MAEDELTRLLRARFGAGDFTAPPELEGSGTLTGMAGRASCRAFEAREVPLEIVRALCAVALSAPSKSDLQQRDIVIVEDAGLRASLLSLVADQAWTAGVPRLVVFCGNNRRQRQLHEMWQRPFANDHLDAFFNAAVDAGIALGSFVTAAEAAGLGCCPISTIRNHAAEASELLGLPDHVFPVAALALGYPAAGARRISMRLPLTATVHVDGYRDAEAAAISGYDTARDAAQPATKQRQVEVFGTAERYVWSDDKTRQYSRPERPDFSAFIRGKGFRLD